MKTLALELERTMRGVLDVASLKRTTFNNIFAMEISVVFEFNSTNSTSADANVDTFRFYQIS